VSLENWSNVETKNLLKVIAQRIDKTYLNCHLRLFGDKPGIRGLLCHSVFNSEDEINLNHVLPQQGLTLDHYSILIETFLDAGYIFVSPNTLFDEADSRAKYIYLTFDDGYYNNVHILPLLQKYKVSAHIFVCSDNILNNRKYWWDVVYQKRVTMGTGLGDINSEITSLKALPIEEIEEYIEKHFGSDSFVPLSDVDRPLSPSELKKLASEPFIHIGSHTNKHSVLTNLPTDEAETEILLGNQKIGDILGENPRSFAFPNGDYSPEHIKILERAEMEIAFSCDEVVSKLPDALSGSAKLKLGRFCFTAYRDHAWQFGYFRVGHSIIENVRKLAQ